MKQEKIKEAWGDDFPKSKGVDENGWSVGIFFYEDIDLEKYDTSDITEDYYFIRPKALQGIENNNGWIKIESETQIKDFQNEFCWVAVKSGEVEKMYIHSSNKSFVLNMCTHYQPIKTPKPPIY